MHSAMPSVSDEFVMPAPAEQPAQATAGYTSTLRPRRLRRTPALRRLVRETSLAPNDFIYPLFVRHGVGVQRPIRSMPGQFQWSVDRVVGEVKTAHGLGIPAVVLFGIPDMKDACGSENYDPDGIAATAIRAIKDAVPEMIVISDLCFCEYTDHGHCGVINQPGEADYDAHLPAGYLLNEPTLRLLAQAAIVHAEAGADIIAPSGMIDGMVGAIRTALDSGGMGLTYVLEGMLKAMKGESLEVEVEGPRRHEEPRRVAPSQGPDGQ